MDEKLDRILGRLDELAALLTAVRSSLGSLALPDQTVALQEAVVLSGLSASGLKRLTDQGVFIDARPAAERRNGVPRRWWKAELVAYHQSGEAGVKSVRQSRGR